TVTTSSVRHFYYCNSAYRLLFFFFFFSSRRRHTRSKRDWSSDVCSSDLLATRTARRLEAEGWLAHAAGDGPTGVSEAARLQPDLIVLDVMLPGLDGLEVCRRIQADRTSAGRAAAPIMMLTARDDETDMLV